MKNICFLLIASIFFMACSSKPNVNINEKINSISLYEEVVIGNVPRTVQSPVSVGLGLGGFVSNSVSVGVGTSFHPEFSNDEALVLERSFAVNNLSLASLIKNEFKSQLMNDGFYKDKFVPFGSDFVIHVFVPKYSVETVIFSPKAQIKMFIEIRILNKFNEIVYEDIQENEFFSQDFLYTQNEILNSKEALEKATYLAIRQTIARLILKMKKS